MASLKEILAHLHALFEQGSSESDDFLRLFQHEVQAWEVADQLLHTDNLPSSYYYYAANTLQCKIQQHMGELNDPPARQGFRESLMSHLVKHTTGDEAVLMRLAICMGDLAIFMSGMGEWDTVLEDLQAMLGESADTLAPYLLLLTVLPEECMNPNLRIEEDHRTIAKHTLRGGASGVLGVLYTCLQHYGKELSVQNQVLTAYVAWIKELELPPNVLTSTPLFTQVFDALQVSELFEVAANSICSLIRSSCDLKRYGAVAQELIPRVLALGEGLEWSQLGNTETHMLSNIFVEFGESYLSWVAELSDDAAKAMQILLKLSRHPNKKVSNKCFNFWFGLQREILSEGNDDYRADLILRFRAYLEEFVLCLVQVMAYPVDYHTWSEDEKEDSRRYRMHSGEALEDVARMIGVDRVLAVMSSLIKERLAQFQADAEQWHDLEAALHTLRTLAPLVSKDEKTYTPYLMSVVPQMTDVYQLRYTATLICGRYCDWVNANPDCLGDVLGFVVSGFEGEDLRRASTKAFKYLCSACSSRMVSHFQHLLTYYDNSRQLKNGSATKSDIAAGVIKVMCALPSEEIAVRLDAIIGPHFFNMQQSLDGDHKDANSRRRQMLHAVDCIAEIIDFFSHKRNGDSEGALNALSSVVKQYFPLLWRAVEAFANDSNTLERICRVYKYFIKKGGPAAYPSACEFLPALVDLCAYLPEIQPSFIYLLSVAVDGFSHIPDSAPMFKTMLTQVAQVCVTLLHDEKAFIKHPDVVDDFFRLCIRFMSDLPLLFFDDSELLEHVFVCAVTGLHVQHRSASQAVHLFLSTFCGLGVDMQHRNKARRSKPIPEVVAKLQVMLMKHGEWLVTQLMGSISDGLPYSMLGNPTGLLWEMLLLARDLTRDLLTKGLGHLGDAVADQTKQEFYDSVFYAVDNPPEGYSVVPLNSIADISMKFARRCRKSTR
jgi:transportin-3